MTEPHACICDDCSPVPYEDRCQFEKKLDESRHDAYALRWYRESLMLKIPAHIREGQALVGRLFMEQPLNDPVAALLKLRSFIATEFEYAEHDQQQNPVTLVMDVHPDNCSLCEAERLLVETEQYR